MLLKSLALDYCVNYGSKPKSKFRLIISCWFNPSMKILFWYRFCRQFNLYQNKVIRAMYRKVMLKRNVDISIDSVIEPGLKLPHPLGIVIGSGVHVAGNVTIYQNVTLGTNPLSKVQYYPDIPEGVVIGVNAVVIGAVKIEPFSVLKANSLHL